MMDRFFTFLQTYWIGVLFLLFCLAFLVQWFAWIFGIGRFSKAGRGTTDTDPSTGKGTGQGTGTGTGIGTSRAELRYIFSEATVKIINDFRHLLALVIVLIFAFALGFSLIKAASIPSTGTPSVIDNMKEALQVVVATLGGLVGSIIGYYFGESKAPQPSTQTPPPDTKPIIPVKAPSPGVGTPPEQ